MAKSLTSLWLKNMRRMGKAQQAQGRQLLMSLIPRPSRAVRPALVRQSKPAKIAKAKTIPKAAKAARPKAIKPLRQPPALPVRPAKELPGSWKKAFFSISPKVHLTTVRRMLYWLYVPSGIAKGPRPLVVMLHGCQQTATEFAAATRMNKLAERKGFAVLYPQQSAATDSHRCWHWYKRATQQGLGDVTLIAEMVAQVQARHGLDASRTYVAGLSAGAGLAAILALRHPQLIAAVGLHSAPVFGTSDSPFSAFKAMQHGSSLAHRVTAHEFVAAQPQFPGIPVMLLHGKRDAVVRPINMDQLTTQFAIINAPFITRADPVRRSYPGRVGGRSPRHAYQTVTYYAGRKPEVVRCEIDSLGHAWSGGDASMAFSAPEGPDATLLLWNFFSRQKRTQKAPVAVKS